MIIRNSTIRKATDHLIFNTADKQRNVSTSERHKTSITYKDLHFVSVFGCIVSTWAGSIEFPYTTDVSEQVAHLQPTPNSFLLSNF